METQELDMEEIKKQEMEEMEDEELERIKNNPEFYEDTIEY